MIFLTQNALSGSVPVGLRAGCGRLSLSHPVLPRAGAPATEWYRPDLPTGTGSPPLPAPRRAPELQGVGPAGVAWDSVVIPSLGNRQKTFCVRCLLKG